MEKKTGGSEHRPLATTFKGFYETLDEQVKDYRGEFDDMIYLCPEFFRLFTNLLEDKRVARRFKPIINATIAYFVAPYDVIPEEVYGPIGYMDDLFLCAYSLEHLLKDGLKDDVIMDAWEGEGDIMPLIEEVLTRAREEIDGKEEKILDYVGLEPDDELL